VLLVLILLSLLLLEVKVILPILSFRPLLLLPSSASGIDFTSLPPLPVLIAHLLMFVLLFRFLSAASTSGANSTACTCR